MKNIITLLLLLAASQTNAQTLQFNTAGYPSTWGTRMFAQDGYNGAYNGIDLAIESQASNASWYKAVSISHGQDSAHPSIRAWYGAYLATEGGNVGIGTISPREKLVVNGNTKVSGIVYARKIVVSTSTSWPDFVFTPAYRLKPLSDVEKFIKRNNHLPDVPNAKKVEEEGVDLGSTQAILLQKIEELTLYMIDLKKESIKQQKEIKQLKARIAASK